MRDSNRRQMTKPHGKMQAGNIVLMIVNYIVVAGNKYSAKLAHEFDWVLTREWNVEQARFVLVVSTAGAIAAS